MRKADKRRKSWNCKRPSEQPTVGEHTKIFRKKKLKISHLTFIYFRFPPIHKIIVAVVSFTLALPRHTTLAHHMKVKFCVQFAETFLGCVENENVNSELRTRGGICTYMMQTQSFRWHVIESSLTTRLCCITLAGCSSLVPTICVSFVISSLRSSRLVFRGSRPDATDNLKFELHKSLKKMVQKIGISKSQILSDMHARIFRVSCRNFL